MAAASSSSGDDLRQKCPSDADLEKSNAEYEADMARIKNSGPHTMTPEMQAKNRLLRETLRETHGIYTIPDAYKLSDCDLLYRFLIARKWEINDAIDGIKHYIGWRRSMGVDTCIHEKVDDAMGDMPPFMGRDRDGYPIMYNAPDPLVLRKLIQTEKRETLIRRHLIVMERGRYLCKKFNVDRVTCIFDLSSVTMSSVTSEVLGLLKEMSHLDQTVYPENMRRMIVCNGGWAVSAMWKVVRPLLDKRVQQKISFVSGAPSVKILEEFIDPTQIPSHYGGSATGEDDVDFVKMMTGQTEVSPPRTSATTAQPDKQVDEEFPLSFTKSKRDPESEDEGSDGFYSIDSLDGDAVCSPISQSPNLTQSTCEAQMFSESQELEKKSSTTYRNPRDAARETPLLPLPRSASNWDGPKTPGTPGSPARIEASQLALRKSVDAVFAQLKHQMSERNNGVVPRAAPGMRAPACLLRLEKCSVSLRVSIGDVQVAHQQDTNIFRGSSQELMCKVVRDSNHTFHPYGLLTDVGNIVRYAVKKRHLHDQLHIFDIQGNRALVTENLQSTVRGDKIHILTVVPNEDSGDRRDWILRRHRTKPGPFTAKPSREGVPPLASKVGSIVSVSTELLAGEIDPEAVVALILCIVHLWRYSTM